MVHLYEEIVVFLIESRKFSLLCLCDVGTFFLVISGALGTRCDWRVLVFSFFTVEFFDGEHQNVFCFKAASQVGVNMVK